MTGKLHLVVGRMSAILTQNNLQRLPERRHIAIEAVEPRQKLCHRVWFEGAASANPPRLCARRMAEGALYPLATTLAPIGYPTGWSSWNA
jgi:hypothetical protein